MVAFAGVANAKRCFGYARPAPDFGVLLVLVSLLDQRPVTVPGN